MSTNLFIPHKSSIDERINQPDSSIAGDRAGLTVTNGRLVFSNPTEFETHVVNLQGQNLDNVEASLSFQSFRKYSNGSEAAPIIDDPYFTSVVNKDGILQIGSDAFKICPADRKVLVCRNANETKVAQLKNTTISGGIPAGMACFYF